MADRLTFVINPDDESASVGLFLKSLQDISRLLRDVDYAIYGAKPKHRWVIHELKSSAPSITLQPDLSDGHAVQAIGTGLHIVTTGTDHPPPYFTEQVLEDLKRMRRLFGGKSRARSISVSVNYEEAATIRSDIAEKASRILTAGYQNLGSLQGTLGAINVHGTPTVTIWDRVSRAPVRCSIPKSDEWIAHVKTLLAKRVLVTGKVHYFVNGTPRSISGVIEIEDATPDRNLPRAEFGSIPDRRVREVGAAQWLASIRGVSER
jgi:hypothetical protein